MKCKRLSIDDPSRHVPIYRNGHFRKMRPQFRKLHFRKLKTQQRHLIMLSFGRLQNWDIFVEIVSDDAGIVTLILLQALTFKKKKKCLFNFSLQSGRNVVSQLTLTYSLKAVVSFETKCVFVCRHSAQIVFVV